MAESAVLEGLAELKKHLKEAKETSVTKAEHEEKFGKLKAEVDKITEALKAEVERKTQYHVADASPAKKAAVELFHRGCKSVKHLTKVETFEHAIDGRTLDIPTVSKEAQQALYVADLVYICDALKSRADRGWEKRKRAEGEREAFLSVFPDLGGRFDAFVSELKALATGTTAGIAEWIPTGFSSSVLDEIRLANPTINLFPTIMMPTNPWVNPLLTGIGTCLIKAENTAITESNLSSGKRTWTAKAFANYQLFSDEASEDSIIAVAAEVRRNVVRSLDEGLERGIVSGDSDGTHIDTDYQAGSAAITEKAFGGLRKFALDPKGTGAAATVDGGAAQLSVAMIGLAIARQRKFGHNPRDGFVLVDSNGIMRLITEAASPVLTRDKFGDRATIESGALASIWGRPIFVSHGVDQRRVSVSATGVNAASGNTLSTALVGNRANFRLGDRRQVTIEDDRNIVTGQTLVVGSARWAFNSIEGDITDSNFNPSGVPAVVAIINII